MSTAPNVFETRRLSLRPGVVELFRRTAGPEVQRATSDIAAWQDQINTLREKITDAEMYVAEIQQAVGDVAATADLPPAALPLPDHGSAEQHAEAFGGPQTGFTLTACPCGEPMENDEKRGWIHRVEGGWEAAGENCHHLKGATKVLAAVEERAS